MRFRNLVLAACAAFGLAMPAQAQLTFEWHLVGINLPSGTATQATAQTNPAITQNFFQTNPLVEGQVVTLQLMIRDNHPMGQTFNWGFGNGVIPPPPGVFDGTGFASLGATLSGTPGVFAPNGTGALNNRLVPPINSELLGPNSGGGNYPLPNGDFTEAATGTIWTPYGSGLGGFGTLTGATLTPNHTVGIVDGNPWENGDFPRQRPGTSAYLMPWFNMKFTAVAPGAASLTLSQLAGFPNVVAGLNAVPPPGGDMLDGPMFSSYIPLNITVVPVPEPTSMALVGMAIAGIGYRKLRRKTTKEVVA